MNSADGDLDPLEALAPTRVAAHLTTACYGRSYELLAHTTSTNDLARERALAGAVNGHVVVADQQSAGRGSHGRAWSSPAGSDLYFSIVDSVALPLSQLPPLTLAIGLGVAEALDACLDARMDTCPDEQPDTNAPHHRAQVKWPNDVWLDGRKCAGILVEVSSNRDAVQSLVIGIGVNVNRRTFPEGLEHPATSLAQVAAHDHDRGRVLSHLLARTETWVRRFEAEGPASVIEALRERLLYVGQQVTCGDVEGRLLGVAAGGELRLSTAGGEVTVLSGRLRLKG